MGSIFYIPMNFSTESREIPDFPIDVPRKRRYNNGMFPTKRVICNVIYYERYLIYR